MTAEEIKLRQLTNQSLIMQSDKITVARSLCGIQAQFFPNVLHSLKIRCRDFRKETSGEGLVKNWTLRGTVHAFAQDDLPLFLDEQNYRSNRWEAPNYWNQRKDWAMTSQRQRDLSSVILQALAEGEKSREELKSLCREQGMTDAEEASMFHPWGGGIRQLCERGFLHYKVQEQKVFCLSPEAIPLLREESDLELARRYFASFGPATVHDAMYFFRTTASQVKKWLSQLPVSSFEWDGRSYFFIENGMAYEENIPSCIFLAGFDQLMLGYEKKESLYLRSEDMRSVFNLAGIVMPSLLLNGEIAGKWKAKNGTLTIYPFRHLSQAHIAVVKDKAETLWPDIQKIKIEE